MLSTTSTSLKGKCPFLPFSSPSHIPFSFCFVTLIVSPAWRVEEEGGRVSGGGGGGREKEEDREWVKGEDRGRVEEEGGRVSGGGWRARRRG